MGKPRDTQPVKISENYGWGEFGSASPAGVSLSNQASGNVYTIQKGIGQYLNELINPSYNNESFRARQELLDASNRQYANQLGAQALARGARGSVTQNILNSIAANRNMDMRQAMTEEDARVQNILSALSGIEGNYWQQSQGMADNILKRVAANQGNQQAVNAANTQAYNAWKNNMISGAATLLGAMFGGGLGAAAGKAGADALTGED